MPRGPGTPEGGCGPGRPFLKMDIAIVALLILVVGFALTAGVPDGAARASEAAGRCAEYFRDKEREVRHGF